MRVSNCIWECSVYLFLSLSLPNSLHSCVCPNFILPVGCIHRERKRGSVLCNMHVVNTRESIIQRGWFLNSSFSLLIWICAQGTFNLSLSLSRYLRFSPLGRKMVSFGWLPSIETEEKTFEKSCGTSRDTLSLLISIPIEMVTINRWWCSFNIDRINCLILSRLTLRSFTFLIVRYETYQRQSFPTCSFGCYFWRCDYSLSFTTHTSDELVGARLFLSLFVLALVLYSFFLSFFPLFLLSYIHVSY